jgi:hypothetical protein
MIGLESCNAFSLMATKGNSRAGFPTDRGRASTLLMVLPDN